jgi:predicted amidophosphoribosyltransferase
MADRETGTCARCRRSPGRVDAARAFGSYDGTLRAILHALKYGRRESLARPLAQLMRGPGADLLRGADAVVPVPLHPIRHLRRGFNQAEALASELGPPVLRALCRVRPTAPQSALRAGARRRNVRDAFTLSALGRGPAVLQWADGLGLVRPSRTARAVAGRCLVLVDDVSTTGATLDECARILKAAGAREVRALTAARALPGRS